MVNGMVCCIEDARRHVEPLRDEAVRLLPVLSKDCSDCRVSRSLSQGARLMFSIPCRHVAEHLPCAVYVGREREKKRERE